MIKDMYEDGDPVTRKAISQAWANVRPHVPTSPRPHITPQQPTVKSQELVREELV